MKVLSLFLTSNRVYLLLDDDGNFLTENFPFYPFFQTVTDLEYLIISYLKSIPVDIAKVTIIPISTIHNYEVFGKKVNYLSSELKNKNDFLYIYFDNLNFYSVENISGVSFGLSTRSDNFISNRSVFSCNKFNGDIEEVVFLSKSIKKSYSSKFRKVVVGGDYFNNSEIPNEFKLNLIAELLEKGFYEVYVDSSNSYPNFLNFRNNTSVPLKPLEFQEFCYLLTSDKSIEVLLEQGGGQKFLNLKNNETYFIHLGQKDLKLKYKGRGFKNEESLLSYKFSGIFIDFRDSEQKKTSFGLENLRKVLLSIEANHDYSSI